MFTDRTDAGRQLADALQQFKGRNVVILALPRGGLPVAYEVAKSLDAPLDLVLVRKIGAPYQKELAVGAIVDGEHPQIVTNPDVMRMLGISQDYIDEAAAEQLKEIERRRKLYFGHSERVPLDGKTAIIIDDGIATGATMRAALQAILQSKAEKVIIAVPVASPDIIRSLKAEADEVICLEEHPDFGAVGMYYQEFFQVSDDEVVRILGEASGFGKSASD